MTLLTDGMLIAASLFAGGYCWVLARRVADLKNLDKGLGGSIVTLTRQIELARATLEEARASAKSTRDDLGQLSGRAEAAAAQLRLLLATMDEQDYAKPAPRSEPLTARRETPPRNAKAAPEPRAAAEPVANRPEPLTPAAARPKPVVATPDIPKPRSIRPLSSLLRPSKPEPVALKDVVSSEDEIMNALRAMAGGGN